MATTPVGTIEHAPAHRRLHLHSALGAGRGRDPEPAHRPAHRRRLRRQRRRGDLSEARVAAARRLGDPVAHLVRLDPHLHRGFLRRLSLAQSPGRPGQGRPIPLAALPAGRATRQVLVRRVGLVRRQRADLSGRFRPDRVDGADRLVVVQRLLRRRSLRPRHDPRGRRLFLPALHRGPRPHPAEGRDLLEDLSAPPRSRRRGRARRDLVGRRGDCGLPGRSHRIRRSGDHQGSRAPRFGRRRRRSGLAADPGGGGPDRTRRQLPQRRGHGHGQGSP